MLKENQKLAEIQQKLKNAEKDQKSKVSELRGKVDLIDREIVSLSKDRDAKKFAMQAATEAYVRAEEALETKRDKKKEK